MMFGNGLGHILSEGPKKGFPFYSPLGIRFGTKKKKERKKTTKKTEPRNPAVVWVKFGYHAM